ncbi:unnamed protein product [Urochloa decumbens]|uniref:Late embryogenesis abundant protein LEA-2 subgroup domain-containing protein n=1 Tax=Urochloa decumbens TaxID=240449 RepID=A0ABC9D6A0_9POAL
MGFWEKCDRECTWNKICYWVWTTAICGGVFVLLIFTFAVRFLPLVTSEDAELQRFDLIPGTPPTNSSVSFNATVMLALHNPNIYRGISYGPLAASFFFNGYRIHDSTVTAGFYHKPRKTVRLHLTVGGVDRPVILATAGVLNFEAENVTGVFGLELRLETMIQYKGRKRMCEFAVTCPLKLQLVHPGISVSPAANNRTNCTWGENAGHNFCPTRCYSLKEDGGRC